MLKEVTNSIYFDYYGEYLFTIEAVIEKIVERIREIDQRRAESGKRRLCDNIRYRIKSPESMKAKLEKRGLATDVQSAVQNVCDAAGVRIICPYMDDVYTMAGEIAACSDIEICEVKDYIKKPKDNGYRSYHMIVETSVLYKGETVYVKAEIQIRTMVMNSWASCEHQMKYKKDKTNRESTALLKRCADEMLNIDYSMMKIRDMMNNAEDTCKKAEFAL
ncbi:MAG: GTP pyrophosphokinase family protein [Clostridia bacterium]|nr:GTP pyrophosphokinase family protein [Clostridia bacterium]